MFKKTAKIWSALLIVFLLFTGCVKKDDYIDSWYALTQDQEQVMIVFTEKEIIFSAGEITESYTYKVTSNGFKNETEYVVMNTNDGVITLAFPNKKDKSNAVIISTASKDEPLYGKLLYTLNRDNYPQQNYRLS